MDHQASLARTVRRPARSSRAALRRLAPVVLAAAALSCRHGSGREFLWSSEVPDELARVTGEYRIVEGDVLAVRVWQQDTMSADRVRVREDGKISVPFLQDVEAAGVTPADLAGRLRTKLKSYVVSPVVTVTVVEQRPMRISVLGEVTRTGIYDLERGAGVLNAIAAAGGLGDYAHRDRIFVLRQGYWADGNRAPARIRFRWETLARGERGAATFQLRPGDVVVVE
jgi:polysaccharide biosynthesis/export protein